VWGMKKLLMFPLFIIFMFHHAIFGEDTEFETNTGVSFEKGLGEGTDAFFDAQIKHKGFYDFNYFRRFEAGGDFDISERIGVRASVKSISILDADTWELRYAPGVGVTFKWRPSRYEIDLRNTFELWNVFNDHDLMLRFKQRIKVSTPVQLKDLEMKLYASEEYLLATNSDSRLVRNRVSAGNTFYLGSSFSINTYYMWQSKNGSMEWTDSHILGTKLNFSF
jgi:Protein of unknown function (DUF2490)